jgi:hypothetical protein
MGLPLALDRAFVAGIQIPLVKIDSPNTLHELQNTRHFLTSIQQALPTRNKNYIIVAIYILKER